MRTQILLLAVVALVGAAVAKKGKGADEKVKVAVYYESRCPDSKTFIVQQLAPVWKDLRGSIKVKLVPYGKASQTKVDGKWKFECQHGEAECYGNKIQSCILKDKKIVDTDKVAAVVCLMSQDDPEKSLTKCGDEVKLAKDVVSRIQECSDSEQGSNLLAVNGDKTHAVEPKITFVPTVIFNESFDQALQNQAITNLKSVICQLTPKKPAACN